MDDDDDDYDDDDDDDQYLQVDWSHPAYGTILVCDHKWRVLTQHMIQYL